MNFSGIHVSAPARLHFGFYSIGSDAKNIDTPVFGGIGLVIDSSFVTVDISPHQSFEITSDDPDLVRKIVKQWLTAFGSGFDSVPSCVSDLKLKIHLETSMRHCGLGSGTQIALALARSLGEFHRLPVPGPEELAIRMDRAKRSAIGSYGFWQGGFLVDRGLSKKDRISPLDLRLEFPNDWPVLMVIPKDLVGLSGAEEADAFAKLKHTENTAREKMISLVRDQIVPAIVNRHYMDFAEGLYEFGFCSGLHFSQVQNGPFCHPMVAQIVNFLRQSGVRATGQSSWGPTVFGIGSDQTDVSKVVAELRAYLDRTFPQSQFDVYVTFANNVGHVIRSESE